MNNIQTFQYDNNPVSFQMGEGTRMLNATEMAKKFGKRPVDFLKLDQTNAFLLNFPK